MARIWTAAGALRRGERGFTLVELLLAATMGLVVVGGAVTVFVGAIRSEPRVSEQVTSIQQGRVAMERLTRELRQGQEVPTATSSQLAIVTYVNEATCGGSPSSTAIVCRVTYTCTGGACSRFVSQPDGTLPGASEQVVSGLADTNVFSYLPDSVAPSYVGATFSFAQDSGDPITLEDGVALRNPSGGAS